MKDSAGTPSFPIWLIGDSPPEKWADMLDTPLDPKHPARHSIWTSIADPMQDRLYRLKKRRLDTSNLYIRNASDRPLEKPPDIMHLHLMQEAMKELLRKHQPALVLTFGANAFMITRVACGDDASSHAHSAELLGIQFRKRVEMFDSSKVNIIPLLHASIARGKFLQAHKAFTGGGDSTDYFTYVGNMIADLLLTKLFERPIWIT